MSTRFYWGLWLIGSVALAIYLYAQLSGQIGQSALMPGPLSNGHHQLEDDCSICHGDAFGGGEVMQEACLDCHGELHKKPMDSHPLTKFKDPRNADLLDRIDALHCVTCHTEHKAEITRKDGITQPIDFCFNCHQDIGEDRESHQGMEFSTCKNAGCHNFHNNRAIYTDFLVKHLEDPAQKERPRIKKKEFGGMLDELIDYPHDAYPVKPLSLQDADFPENQKVDAQVMSDWVETAHASAGVNCSACHQPPADSGKLSEWQSKPGEKVCARCHQLELEQFGKGKHGMRLASGLPAMKVADARLKMKRNPQHDEVSCNSCHGAHRYDIARAAVDACLGCHDDRHSKAFTGSPHDRLWQLEVSAEGPANSGVSCATCHMPRINVDVNDWVSRIMVEHNQSANLSPNSKMIRTTCLTCHGMNFSLQALTDPAQIDSNFSLTPPATEHPSMQLARRDNERYLRETTESQPDE